MNTAQFKCNFHNCGNCPWNISIIIIVWTYLEFPRGDEGERNVEVAMVCVLTRYPLRARKTIPIPLCALGLGKSKLVPHKLIYQLFCFILSFCAGPPAEGKNAVYCLINASPQQQFFLLLFYVFKAVCRDSVYSMLLPYFYTRARGNYCEISLLGFHFLSNTTIWWVKRVDMNQIITLKNDQVDNWRSERMEKIRLITLMISTRLTKEPTTVDFFFL